MNGSRSVSFVMVIGVLGAVLGCGDKNTITGPEAREPAAIALSDAGSGAPPLRSGSANSARTVVRPSTSGGSTIAVGPRPTISPTAPQGASGTWTGSITFDASPEGGDEPCETIASITANLIESGGNLTGQFRAGCHGTLVLHGVLRGGQIFGSLDELIGTSYGRVLGTVSSDRIQFRTVQQLVGDGDEPDDDRDDVFISSRVDLSR